MNNPAPNKTAKPNTGFRFTRARMLSPTLMLIEHPLPN
jgi:hypothetical protein